MSSGYFCKHLCSSRSSCHYAFGFAPKMAEPQDALVPIDDSQNPHASVDALALVPIAESEDSEEVPAKKARTDEAQSKDVLAVVPIDEPKDPDEVAARTLRTDEKVTWEHRSSKDEMPPKKKTVITIQALRIQKDKCHGVDIRKSTSRDVIVDSNRFPISGFKKTIIGIINEDAGEIGEYNYLIRCMQARSVDGVPRDLGKKFESTLNPNEKEIVVEYVLWS